MSAVADTTTTKQAGGTGSLLAAAETVRESTQELPILVVGVTEEHDYLVESISSCLTDEWKVTALGPSVHHHSKGYSVVLVDFDIGEWLALRWIRAFQECSPETRVVAIVGHWDAREPVARHHADGVLRKPFQPQEVRQWLRSASQPGACVCTIQFADPLTEAPDTTYAWIP